jgi:hypothetical protein
MSEESPAAKVPARRPPATCPPASGRHQFGEGKRDALARWAWALANDLKPDGNVTVLPRRWAGTSA